ncbi:MAG: hypothetical protein JXR84_13145 [Anaerolineae bacterium]|nr:hypothetical protein [Anaerolineae bacterium]
MKKKKIERGQPLDEAKGSIDYMTMQIRRHFREQFPYDDSDADWLWVREIFTDHVIVESDKLQPEEYYFVPYRREGERYVFDPREQWEVVELAYVPQTTEQPMQESASQGATRQRLVETIPAAVRLLTEGKDNPNGPWLLEGIGVTADTVNANRRRYPGPVLESALRRLRSHLNESAGQGRLKIESSSVLTGEADHPTSKGNRHPILLETVVNWTGVGFDGKHAIISGKLLGTGNGKDVRAIMEGGVIPGISQRAYGESRIVEEDGQQIEEVTWLEITGYDLTAPYQQSDPEAGVTLFESKDENRQSGDETMLLDLEKLRKEYPDLVRAIIEEHDAQKRAELEEALQRKAEEDARKVKLLAEHDKDLRALLGLNETADITEAMRAQGEELMQLRDEKRQREIDEYIESQTKDLPYNQVMKKSFVEAIKAAKPRSIEEAKTVIVGKRKEYDAIQADLVLSQRGFGAGGIRMMGPVIESELGIPAYARAGWELQESMMASGLVRRWDHRKPVTAAEIFAAKYLARFDEVYRGHMIREARRFEEAEITSDLNLPYSVSRAIVAEALPMLVAADVFATGTTDVSPFRLYYEEFSGDTGYTGTSTAEAVTADLDTWVAMTYKRLTPGTVVVTNSGATVTYTEGSDYVVDYAGGRFKALTAGTITDAQSLKATYNYTAIRKGEMAAIERGELNLTYKTVDSAADRLAQQISSEAVVFSRSQLGWDATQRTLTTLVAQVRRKIDQGMLYMGLAAALSVANNISGTWTAATDSLDSLVKLIGQAGVKVWNRYYEPTGLVASRTNADLISNWTGFKRDGFPDAVLNANGFVGRVKGYPLFASTEFSDSYLLIANRELVMHWVFSPMTIKGPFPTYDVSGGTSKLIAADQYYAEEYNVTDSPVAEKGALVKIA